jgi:hypothetical protein
MTEATMRRPDGIHYHVEELSENRGQLMADVVARGRRARTHRFGSPAPLDHVRKAAMRLNSLPHPTPRPRSDDHDRQRPLVDPAAAVASTRSDRSGGLTESTRTP